VKPAASCRCPRIPDRSWVTLFNWAIGLLPGSLFVEPGGRPCLRVSAQHGRGAHGPPPIGLVPALARRNSLSARPLQALLRAAPERSPCTTFESLFPKTMPPFTGWKQKHIVDAAHSLQGTGRALGPAPAMTPGAGAGRLKRINDRPAGTPRPWTVLAGSCPRRGVCATRKRNDFLARILRPWRLPGRCTPTRKLALILIRRRPSLLPSPTMTSGGEADLRGRPVHHLGDPLDGYDPAQDSGALVRRHRRAIVPPLAAVPTSFSAPPTASSGLLSCLCLQTFFLLHISGGETWAVI